MKIKCMNDLLKNLKKYKFYYYEWKMINDRIQSIQSPKFSDLPKSIKYADKTKKLNHDIERKKELENKMSSIEELVDILKDSDNSLFYPVIYYRFIEFQDMKEIAKIYFYDERQMYRIYEDAMNELFKMSVNVSKCQ